MVTDRCIRITSCIKLEAVKEIPYETIEAPAACTADWICYNNVYSNTRTVLQATKEAHMHEKMEIHIQAISRDQKNCVCDLSGCYLLKKYVNPYIHKYRPADRQSDLSVPRFI